MPCGSRAAWRQAAKYISCEKHGAFPAPCLTGEPGGSALCGKGKRPAMEAHGAAPLTRTSTAQGSLEPPAQRRPRAAAPRGLCAPHAGIKRATRAGNPRQSPAPLAAAPQPGAGELGAAGPEQGAPSCQQRPLPARLWLLTLIRWMCQSQITSHSSDIFPLVLYPACLPIKP